MRGVSIYINSRNRKINAMSSKSQWLMLHSNFNSSKNKVWSHAALRAMLMKTF